MKKHLEPQEDELKSVLNKIRERDPNRDFSDIIITKIKEQNIKPVTTIERRIKMKKSVIATTVAASLALVIASGFVSPTMAESLQQVPGVKSIFKLAGDLGLRVAVNENLVSLPNVSASNENLSLIVPEIIYDGTRVSLSLERNPKSELSISNNPLKKDIKNVSLLINGEDIQSFGPDNSNDIVVFQYAGVDNNSVILEFSDLRNQGGKILPNSFDLTLNVDLKGESKTLSIEVPVKKNDTGAFVTNINATKKSEDFTIKFQKIEITPVTTNLSTVLSLPEGKIYDPLKLNLAYDVVDSDGNSLKLLSSNEWHETNGNELTSDIRFQPFTTIPDKITIKPYIIEINKNGTFKQDTNGEVLKQYLPNLEVEVPIKK
ncbi:hypothetical protein AMQ84_31440 [Paenibacillus riograndensis]|uniref:DUF4179 domain-containing protein n=1 Tax=Paenibacillus riograndensis TaxID=483937 RepID=A0A132TDT5_9BACL|nr:DUF4179 domain-containing protein [Paenibacillus riograndensis]KWX69494.1 hypothetical protein AMQ84_31440 [Paenibacillus riograndensis]